MIQAIFFDFNGVISNDEHIHVRAYRQVLEAEGVGLSDEEYIACLCMDDVAFVRAAFARRNQSLNDEKMNDVIEREHRLHRELIKDELPVSQSTVTFIKDVARRYQLGVVSMAMQSEVDHVLQLAGIEKLFTVYVTAGKVARHKPAPDCYLRALELLNDERQSDRRLPLLPHECLVIEDAPPGIQAGRTAGMRTIGLTNTVSENELRLAGADIVTANLADWTAGAVRHLFD